MNLYRQIKLYFLRRKRKRMQREMEELEQLAMWLQTIGAISFIIGCAFEKPNNSLQSQLRRAIENEDYERAAVLRDKIKQK
jgi:UvrB/uvrC motif